MFSRKRAVLFSAKPAARLTGPDATGNSHPVRLVRTALFLALLLCLPLVALAAAPAMVSQFHRAFSLRTLLIPRGGSVHFTNADEFLHQIYINSTAFSFSSTEQAPGEAVDITFPVSGTFEVRCEIHPKMLLSVTVE